MPAGRTTAAVVPAPATPRMSDTFDTRPSLTPNTPLAPRPRCTLRWWCSTGGASSVGAGTPELGTSVTTRPYPRSLAIVPTRYDVTRSELADLLGGEPRYRVDQVWDGLYDELLDPAR